MTQSTSQGLSSDTYLVIGGDGFLGSHIVEQLLNQRTNTSPSVHILDLQQRFPPREHVVYHIGSLLDRDFLVGILKKHHITCVFHTASPPHGKPNAFYWSVNVDGSKSLIQACIEANVQKLVYTSSASVVFNGEDLFNADEELLYCKIPLDAYTETKAAAEDLVLKSNNLPNKDGSTLLTCALRPSGIFGPRDGQTLPGFMKAIADGKSHIVLGNGQNLFDFTYVENVAYAHLLAASKLCKGSKVEGQAFNITNDEPIPFWDFNKRLMLQLLPKNDSRTKKAATIHLPRFLALGLAYLMTSVMFVLGKLFNVPSPLFTPFRVRITTANRTFSCEKAKQRLNYRPLFTLEEGIARSVDWIKTVPQWRSVWSVDSHKIDSAADLNKKEE